MAKRMSLIPAWVQTLDRMIERKVRVVVFCSTCREHAAVDLVALRERVGGQYSLVNRRCRCRLTPGCTGWNQFRYLHGVMRHLADDATLDRWIFDV